MPLYANGTLIPENVANALIVNGVNITQVIANGVAVWTQSLYTPGSQTFTTSGTFTVPANITSINICMIGGGASGAKASSSVLGGNGGSVYSGTIAATPGQQIAVTIGGGGAGATSGRNAGGTTAFGGYTAYGGSAAGGSIVASNTARSTCGGTAYSGLNAGTIYGGQAGFGNGGNASGNGNASPAAAGVGGGGGSIPTGVAASGAGGRGEVRISW